MRSSMNILSSSTTSANVLSRQESGNHQNLSDSDAQSPLISHAPHGSPATPTTPTADLEPLPHDNISNHTPHRDTPHQGKSAPASHQGDPNHFTPRRGRSPSIAPVERDTTLRSNRSNRPHAGLTPESSSSSQKPSVSALDTLEHFSLLRSQRSLSVIQSHWISTKAKTAGPRLHPSALVVRHPHPTKAKTLGLLRCPSQLVPQLLQPEGRTCQL